MVPRSCGRRLHLQIILHVPTRVAPSPGRGWLATRCGSCGARERTDACTERARARLWRGIMSAGAIRIAVLMALVSLMGLLGMCWAVSSAPASAADDDFHLASTWCAWGQEASGCHVGEVANGVAEVRVDTLSRFVSDCWLTHPDKSAACIYQQAEGDSDPIPPRGWPGRANAGAYPSGLYAFFRLFVIPDSVASIVIIRMVSFILCMAFLLGSTLLADPRNRSRLLLYWAVTATPLGIWIFASSNPSGIAVSAAACVFAGSFVVASRPTVTRAWAAAALSALAVLVGDAARSDSIWFCSLGLMCGLLAGNLLERPIRQWRPALLVVLALALAVYMGRPAGASETTQPVGQAPTWFLNVSNLPALYWGEFAVRLGWLDTFMPSVVWAGVALCSGALGILGLTRVSRGRAAALAVASTAGVLLPLQVLMARNYRVGEYVQPRYVLPVGLIVAGILAVRRATEEGGISRTQAFAVTAVAATAHSFALHANLRRSLTGQDVQDWNLNSGVEWWWDVPVSPMAVWLLGSASYLFLMLWLAWRVTRGCPPGTSPEGAGLERGPGAHGDAPQPVPPHLAVDASAAASRPPTRRLHPEGGHYQTSPGPSWETGRS